MRLYNPTKMSQDHVEDTGYRWFNHERTNQRLSTKIAYEDTIQDDFLVDQSTKTTLIIQSNRPMKNPDERNIAYLKSET